MQFDAGGALHARVSFAAAIAQLGRLREIVLATATPTTAGPRPSSASPSGATPTRCMDAEGSGGWRYWGDLRPSSSPGASCTRRSCTRGSGTAGRWRSPGRWPRATAWRASRSCTCPGHAPGQIALLRRADGVALTTDAFYSIDDWGKDSPPHVPGDYYNLDTQQARVSLRRLAELDVAVAWPGHGEPLRGDVRSQLLAPSDS